MSTQIKRRRGSEVEHRTFTGASGEITVDTTYNALRVHNGVKVGGYSTELVAIARSLGVEYDAVDYGVNGKVITAAMQYIYAPDEAIIYRLPVNLTGETIQSINAGVLITSGGTYPVTNANIDYTQNDGASMIGTDDGRTVQERFDDIEPAVNNNTVGVADHETRIDALETGQSSGVLGYATYSAMTSDLSPDDGAIAFVTNDTNLSLNGYYRKSGASGSGSWIRTNDTVQDGSIDRDKLNRAFSYSGQLSNVSLDTVVDEGDYYFLETNGITGTPSDLTSTSCTLKVWEAFDGNATFLHQMIRPLNTPEQWWIRRLQTGVGGDWQRGDKNPLMWTRTVLANGTDLDTVTDDGIYHLSTTNSYTNFPTDAPTGQAYLLEVKEAFLQGAGRFFQQRLIYSSDPNRSWVRRVDTVNPNTSPWKAGTGSDSSVTRTVLSDYFSDVGQLSNVDLNNIVREGVYLIASASTITNLPKGASSGILEVKMVNGGQWGYQEYTNLFEGGWKQRRMIRPGTSYEPWQGLAASDVTVAVFGDSITELGNYPQKLGEMIGGEILKLGFGGCRMADHSNIYYNEMSMCNMAESIANNDYTDLIAAAEYLRDNMGDDNTTQANLVANTDWSTVDYVVMLWGTNDYAADVPLGTVTDTDGSTFLGGINKTITNLLTAHPQLKILMLTPFWRPRIIGGDGKDSDNFPNGNGTFLREYGEAIQERCRFYHIESHEFYDSIGINNFTQYVYLGPGDDIHPNADGYIYLAQKVAAVFKSKFNQQV